MTAMSLHVGLNAVDPDHYAGWDGALTGCENDARAMAAIASQCGYTPIVLPTATATAKAVLREIADAARLLRPGDAFLFTVACHGSQLPGGDPTEEDGRDEAIVLYDRMLLDDEVGVALGAFAEGVRLEMVADCCHSATVARAMPGTGPPTPRVMPRAVTDAVVAARPDLYSAAARRRTRGRPADVLLLSACRDDEVTGDGPVNGAFTGALLSTWAGGTFAGTYRELRKRIDDLLPDTQNPDLRGWTTAAERLADQRPFHTTHTQEESTMSTATLTNGAATTPSSTTTAPRPIPAGMPSELAARIDLSRLVDPLAGIDTPAQVQTLSELSGARPAAVSRANGGFHLFWWGMNLELSHEELESILGAADAVGTLSALAGLVPSAATPYLEAIAAFIKASAGVLRAVDRGNGVYISMSWIAPGVFVPTTRPAGRSGSRSGELVVQVPDFVVTRTGGDQDTGLIIQPGQRLVISASGAIWSGIWLTQQNGPGGWTGWEASEDAPLPGQPPFSLIGRLDGRTFYVGADLTWVHSGAPSKLSFLINDHRRIGSGSFSVRVDVFAP